MHQPEEAILDLITNRVTVDLHMLSSLVKDRICSNVDRRFTVTKELRFSRELNAKKGEKLLKP